MDINACCHVQIFSSGVFQAIFDCFEQSRLLIDSLYWEFPTFLWYCGILRLLKHPANLFAYFYELSYKPFCKLYYLQFRMRVSNLPRLNHDKTIEKSPNNNNIENPWYTVSSLMNFHEFPSLLCSSRAFVKPVHSRWHMLEWSIEAIIHQLYTSCVNMCTILLLR